MYTQQTKYVWQILTELIDNLWKVRAFGVFVGREVLEFDEAGPVDSGAIPVTCDLNTTLPEPATSGQHCVELLVFECCLHSKLQGQAGNWDI